MKLARKITAVYFLLLNSKVVYIGATNSLWVRIVAHNYSNIEFDSFRYIECKKRALKKYEKRWIIKFRPIHNTTNLYKWIGSWRTGRKKIAYNLN